MHMPEPESLPPHESIHGVAPVRDDYERSDVQIRWILLLFVIVGVGLGLSQLGLWRMLATERSSQWNRSNALGKQATVLPPVPRLQAQPLTEYTRYLNDQNKTLENYGWIDRRKGTVRIPISRALDIIAKRGLPVNSKPNAKEANQPVPPDKTKADSNRSN